MGTAFTEQASLPQYCSECGRPFPAGDLVRFGRVAVCGDCKPTYVQRLREGAIPAGAATGGVIYAGFWIRALAQLLDALFFGVALVILVLIAFAIGSFTVGMANLIRPDSPALTAFVVSLYLVIILSFATYSVYFVVKKGGTPGKLALGLKIVTGSGGPISIGRAIGRYFAHALSGMILYIGYIMAGFDVEKRALHDHICDTRVIRS